MEPRSNATTKPGHLRSLAASLALLLVALAIIKWHYQLPLLSTLQSGDLPLCHANDSKAYLKLAEEGPAGVESPFSKRVLYSWLARKYSAVTGQSLSSSFLMLSMSSLVVLAFALAEILRVTIGKPFLALLFVLTPFPLESFELGYLPDLFHAALTAVFFLLVIREKWLPAMLLLFLEFLARENTLFLCLVTGGIAWQRGQKKIAGGAGAVLCAGWIASSLFGRLGKPNLHHLPDLIYLLGKLPYYFLLNLFGVRIWSDLRPTEGTPAITWHLPSWLGHSADKVIGIAVPDYHYPVSTLIIWLTIFGVGPLILFYVWKRAGRFQDLPFAIQLAIIYGAVGFLAGPLLGDWTDRLVGYGWPLFWIGLPFIARGLEGELPRSQLLLLGCCYSLACWWPRFFSYGNNRSINPWPCFGALVFYIIGWKILKRASRGSTLKQAYV